MTFAALNLLSPLVLAAHNADEYRRYEDFVREYHGRLPAKLASRSVMRNAAILLPIAAAAIAVPAYLWRAPTLMTIARIAIFALMLNAIGHCALSLKRRSMLPGTHSAIALVLPYSSVCVFVMRTQLADSWWFLVRCAALGAVAVPLAVFSSLSISYGISRMTPTKVRPGVRTPDSRHSVSLNAAAAPASPALAPAAPPAHTYASSPRQTLKTTTPASRTAQSSSTANRSPANQSDKAQ